jgi:hypothetical protein
MPGPGTQATPAEPARPAPFHSAEPAPTTFRTPDGRPADLFDLRHYPVRAACQVCGEEIEARSFLRPFRHLDEGPTAGSPLLSHVSAGH